MEATTPKTPAIVDIEALLSPIPGDNPSGVSLRYSDVYDAIQEARRSEDELSQGEWVRKTKTADWPRVIALTTEALSTQTKDLQIAVWLMEALLKRHGFAGLRDGLHVLRGIHEHFWESCYPAIEDGDLDPRIGPLEWLNAKVPATIRSVTITGRLGGENYSWLKWEESKATDNLGRKSVEAMEAARQDGKLSGEEFDKAVAMSSLEFYQSIFTNLGQAQAECVQLDKIVDERFGPQAPSLADLMKAIEDTFALVESILQKKRPREERVMNTDARPDVLGGSQPRPIAPPVEFGSIEPVDRPDALRRLAGVAEFFRRTEPHSPVSYLVQRAILWGEMPLESWLQEVINNEDVLGRVRETLGLKQPKME